MKPRSILEANMQVRSPYEKVQVSLLVKKLSKKFIVKCSSCHNDYANGVIGPSLLNKTSDEILKNINDFKTGIKSNPLMSDLIKLMSKEEIKSLANEIYQFNKMVRDLKNK
jgi:cytochrome c553